MKQKSKINLSALVFWFISTLSSILGIIPLLGCFGNYGGGGCGGLGGLAVLVAQAVVFPVVWLSSFLVYRVVVQVSKLKPVNNKLHLMVVPIFSLLILKATGYFYPTYEKWLTGKHSFYQKIFNESISVYLSDKVVLGDESKLRINIRNDSTSTFGKNLLKIGCKFSFGYADDVRVVKFFKITPGLKSIETSLVKFQHPGDQRPCDLNKEIVVEIYSISPYSDLELISLGNFATYKRFEFFPNTQTNL